MRKLRNRVLDPHNLDDAWKHVRRKNGCAGTDGETIGKFDRNAENNLSKLRQRLGDGEYRPLPLRQILIPKKDGGWRELRVPTVRDRIVQQAILQVLYPVMEKEFETCSFAYRPGRSHLMAVRQVSQWNDRGYEWVLDADIVKYFDSIDRDRLLVEFRERLDNDWFVEQVENAIDVGVLTKKGLILPNKGLPQGAVISPILSNIYLDDFDEYLMESDVKLVRYADDFVILSHSQKRIERALIEVDDLLEDMGLELHPEKTRITNFDKGFRFLGRAFVGDLVVPLKKAKTPKVEVPKSDTGLRLFHLDRVESSTAMEQALLESLQAAERPIPPPLFVVLGYGVRQVKPTPIDTDETIWKPDMATLYLVQQGATLKKEGRRFIVCISGRSNVEIPIREIDRVLVFGNVQLTSSAIDICLHHRIPVVFLTQLGEYKGHLASVELTNIDLQIAQFQRSTDEEFRIGVARSIVRGKLWNSKQLLIRLNRKRKREEVVAAIEGLREDIDRVTDLELTLTQAILFGYEGAGAARYFQALNYLISAPDFYFPNRNYHPPTDPINSMLSFGYTLLFNNVFSLLVTEGLNPYIGNFHGSDRQKPSLAFDLMEEFRSPVVDTLVMQLVNQKTIKPTDFTWPDDRGAIYLTDAARRIFLKFFEKRISLETSHPDVHNPVSYRRAIQLQIQRYCKVLLDGGEYEPFLKLN